MFRLKFNINTKDFKINLVGTVREIRNAAFRGMQRASEKVVEEFKDYIEKNTPAGKTYVIGGKVHRASKAGQPPAELTGFLLNNFETKTYWGKGHISVFTKYENTAISTTSGYNYAHIMEYGAPSTGWGGPVEPRPFMGPVLYSSRIQFMIKETVEAAMRELGWSRRGRTYRWERYT